MQVKTKVWIFRLVGVAMALIAITMLVRRLVYSRGNLSGALGWLILAILYGFLFPRGFIASAQEEARIKAKREEEARKDRERLERVGREEREWRERKRGTTPE